MMLSQPCSGRNLIDLLSVDRKYVKHCDPRPTAGHAQRPHMLRQWVGLCYGSDQDDAFGAGVIAIDREGDAHAPHPKPTVHAGHRRSRRDQAPGREHEQASCQPRMWSARRCWLFSDGCQSAKAPLQVWLSAQHFSIRSEDPSLQWFARMPRMLAMKALGTSIRSKWRPGACAFVGRSCPQHSWRAYDQHSTAGSA